MVIKSKIYTHHIHTQPPIMLCALLEKPPMLKITAALENEVFPNKDINTISSTVPGRVVRKENSFTKDLMLSATCSNRV
jgi:hypothetical protein